MATKHWDQFWADGFITTFGASLQNNYQGVVRDFWEREFDRLSEEVSILDVATGNGAIAILLQTIAMGKNKNVEVFAVDSAEINEISNCDDSSISEASRRVKFYGRTPCENLPFKENSFDMVVSQYGFEYSDINKSSQEIYRVLKQGGKFSAIIHHAESSLIKRSVKELEVYRVAFKKNDIFGGAAKVLKLNAKGLQRNNFIEKYNRAVNNFRLEFSSEQCTNEIVGGLSAALRDCSSWPLKKQINLLNERERVFILAQHRLQDMVSSAMNGEQMNSLNAVLSEVGFKNISFDPLIGDFQDLIGWQFSAKK